MTIGSASVEVGTSLIKAESPEELFRVGSSQPEPVDSCGAACGPVGELVRGHETPGGSGAHQTQSVDLGASLPDGTNEV